MRNLSNASFSVCMRLRSRSLALTRRVRLMRISCVGDLTRTRDLLYRFLRAGSSVPWPESTSTGPQGGSIGDRSITGLWFSLSYEFMFATLVLVGPTRRTSRDRNFDLHDGRHATLVILYAKRKLRPPSLSSSPSDETGSGAPPPSFDPQPIEGQ